MSRSMRNPSSLQVLIWVKENRRPFGRRFSGGDFGRLNDGYDLLALHLAIIASLAHACERDLAGRRSIEGVVLTNAHVLTSFNLRTALADDDLAWACRRTVSQLNAEIFRV